MNAPFFGCCGWAASSIVPTKRYKTYTKQLFDEFSRVNTLQIDSESLEEDILQDEDWPLTLKHASLVKKTIEYVKFNPDKLPKMGRKLRARAQKGLRSGDVIYTCVAVVLMKKVVKEANSAVQMDYYLSYFLEVIGLLLHSQHNILRYQAVCLLKLILEQPLFCTDTSGIIHYEKVFLFSEIIQELTKEYYLNFLLNKEKKNDTNLLLISHCQMCLSYLLNLAKKFKLNLVEEDNLLRYCSGLVGSRILKDEHNFSQLLENFETEHSFPLSWSALATSLMSLFSEVNTANRLSEQMIEDFLKSNAFCSPESVDEVLSGLSKQVLESKGKVTYLYETLMDECTKLYSVDVVQGCNLIQYLISNKPKHDLHFDVSAKAFQQWLYLNSEIVHDDDKELRDTTLLALQRKFTSSTSGDGYKLKLLCVLEDWSIRTKIQEEKLEKTLKELEEIGFKLEYKQCSLGVSKVVLKDNPMQLKDPNICPYERQIMLEEMLLALGSGSI